MEKSLTFKGVGGRLLNLHLDATPFLLRAESRSTGLLVGRPYSFILRSYSMASHGKVYSILGIDRCIV